MNKQCADCKESKPVNSFYKQKGTKDGLTSYCKVCHKKRYGHKKKPKRELDNGPLVGKEKKCPRCKEVKDYSLYHVDKRKKTGRMAACKTCLNKQKRDRYKSDEKVRLYHKNKSKEKITRLKDNITTALYYLTCKCCRETFKVSLHRGDSPQQKKQSVCSKECGYHLAKQKIIRSKADRLKTDIEYALNSRIRSRIHGKLKNYKNSNSFSVTGSIKDLPYNAKQLKAHLQKKFKPGMTWENFLNAEIHIDHIRPLSSFSYKSPSDPQFKQAWSLSNLQPLWAKDNLRKGAKLVTGTQNTLQL